MTAYAVVLIAFAVLWAGVGLLWVAALWLGDQVRRMRADRGCSCGGACRGYAGRQRP